MLVDSLVTSWAADALLAHARRVRVVPLVHMAFETPGERELLAASAAVVTTSAWGRRWLLEHYGLDADRLHVAVPGVEVADPVPGSETGRELLCAASVLPAKGHDVLLSALATLTDLDWRCTLVGPVDLDPDFVDELHKSAADAGIGDRVVFAGPLPHDEMRTAYARADLLVLPSRAESYGMVVTEALAHAPARGRERGRRRTGGARARRRRQQPRAAGAARMTRTRWPVRCAAGSRTRDAGAGCAARPGCGG